MGLKKLKFLRTFGNLKLDILKWDILLGEMQAIR